MNGEKYLWTATGFVLAASLLAASAAAWLTASHASRQTYDLLNAVCSRAVRQEPETADVLLAALKACMKENSGDAVQNKDAQEMRNGAVAEEYAAGNDSGAVQTEVLSAWGYRVSDFSGGGHMQVWRFAAAGFAAGIFLFFGTFRMRNRVGIHAGGVPVVVGLGLAQDVLDLLGVGVEFHAHLLDVVADDLELGLGAFLINYTYCDGTADMPRFRTFCAPNGILQRKTDSKYLLSLFRTFPSCICAFLLLRISSCVLRWVSRNALSYGSPAEYPLLHSFF